MIWTLAAFLLLAWPPAEGKSLGAKALNWIVDPTGALPDLPQTLPMNLDDDGDAVAEHDALEQQYYAAYQGSRLTRMRMDLKAAGDPLETTTERQLLVGVGVLGVLAIWQVGEKKRER
jgi:hypothetical protein